MRPLLALFACLRLGLAAPEIAHFAPHALVPGQTTVLTFSGSDLKSATNLWTSFGAQSRRIEGTSTESVRFEVICPKLAAGIFALQLSGPEGASNYQLVMVDELRPQPHQNNHQSRARACPITVPAAIDCILKSEQSDFYRLTAKAGESLSIEAIAHRIGSDMDPVVRVLDPNGQELAYCDDEPGVWRDARFVFRPPLDGDYLLEVHDAAFGGGTSFDYRLRVTREPLVWFTFPLADPSEATMPFEAIGAGGASPRATSPANPPQAPGLSSLPGVAEQEPNDLPEQGQPLLVPGVIQGRIQRPGDVDYFKLTAAPNDKLILQSQTRSLGSPCDLVLAIKAADGRTVAASDPNRPGDAALTNRFTEAGEYSLEVRDLSGNSQPNVPYRIKAAWAQPGFVASTDETRLQIKPGGTVKFKVNVSRYDYSGTITLKLEPALEGISLESNLIPKDKNDTELALKGADSLRPGDCWHFKVVAHPEANIPPVQVSTVPALRKRFPLMLNPPPALDGLFSLTVRD